MSTQKTTSFLSEVMLYMRRDGTDAPPYDKENYLEEKDFQFVGVSCQSGEIIMKRWVESEGKTIWSFYDAESKPTWVIGTKEEFIAFSEKDARSWG